MFSCLQILEAFLWFVLITLLNVTLIILTLSVSRLLNLLLRLGISTLSQSPMLGFHKQMDNRIKLLEEILSFRMQGVEFDNGDMYVDGHKAASDRKSGSAGMPRPISYAVFCLRKKNTFDIVVARSTIVGDFSYA